MKRQRMNTFFFIILCTLQHLSLKVLCMANIIFHLSTAVFIYIALPGSKSVNLFSLIFSHRWKSVFF